jgi:hypothetical protein
MNQDHRHMHHDLGFLGGEIHFENLFQFLADILEHSLIITAFVLIMMLLIEYLTVQTKGTWIRPFENKPALQILLAALLGASPGCLGVYIVVTLFSHRLFNMAALVTAMIATSGDEAFIMFAMIPDKAILVMLLLFVISIGSGLILNLFPFGKAKMELPVNHLKLHEHDPDCICWDPRSIWSQFRNISFERAVLMGSGIVFAIFLMNGTIGPETWDWKRIIFLLVTLIEVFIVSTVPDHFLSRHLWGHVIRKHFLKIFLWTFGALVFIHAGLEFLHFGEWIGNNQFLILLIAVAVGIIPESGPHIVFITLYVQGVIPLSTLLANSIVQDGHGGLPLLAESRKDFIYVKGINILIGLLIGLAGVFFI